MPDLSFLAFNPNINIEELFHNPNVREQMPRYAARCKFRISASEREIRHDLICKMRIKSAPRCCVRKEILTGLVRDFFSPFADCTECVKPNGNVLKLSIQKNKGTFARGGASTTSIFAAMPCSWSI